MVAYAKSSDLADFKICDASELCNVGEELSFWDLMARAQAQGQVGEGDGACAGTGAGG